MFAIDRRSFLGASLAAGVSTALPAQATATAVLSPKAMRDDLAVLGEVYAALHPGLDRYLGRRAFAARIEALRDWAATERSPQAFFVALGRLTAAVRCGHSYPNPVNQPDATAENLLSGRNRVPFAFRWIDGKMVLTRVLRDELPLRPGMVVEAVDGLPATELLRRLMPLGRADGSNDGKRRALMAVDGTGRYGAFDVYRPLVSAARADGMVDVRMRGKTIRLPAMTEEERQALGKGGQADDGGWEFAIGTDGVGLLRMPNWALYNSKWDWRGFIDRSVDQLIEQRARGLIVDLRENEGGLDCGDVLLERLIAKPVPAPTYRRYVRYRAVPAALRSHLDTWDKSFFDWSDKASDDGRRPGLLRLVREADDEPGAPLRPRGPRYAGPAAVLISPTCSSATFGFAQLIKGSGVATLVGETSGGNQRGINGGAYFFVQLKETGMEVDLPLIGYFPDRPQPDAGIAPDIFVRTTVADVVAGRDRGMDTARRWVRSA
ncbi:peptidase S41 [Sphingomonas lutea]|uniref:Peptidase S41 n=1 Tax=Sphingomonas lutea TaxID=1045317 RepID=A0A7G9SJE8_9SPHN|nr:S41 family peptidase [Sphingomonas lutea]QNN67973.1 peptidase S41 [Sphingomonas lutea]